MREQQAAAASSGAALNNPLGDCWTGGLVGVRSGFAFRSSKDAAQ
jgi:hypothetical protein